LEEAEKMKLILNAQRVGRLSSFLLGELKMSAGLMNRLKWTEAIQVNGFPAHTDYAVKPGDVITVLLDEPEPDYPAEAGELTVLYEDEHLLAVDKPAGMLIHPSRSCNTGTLANYVAGYYRKTGQKSAFHPVTRLDRDTFGVVLLAKNSHVHTLLQSARIRKIYHAYAYGHPEAETGSINAPIARKPLPSLLREIREDGKPSVTEYTVLERNGKLCKLALHPITGRTHQLRLHCCHMGFPILGDPQYCSEESKNYSDGAGLFTQQLCAKELEFEHPITGKTILLESKLDVVDRKN
jgi:23S rRNA pseudouridine1911/1915/1917 synthase